MRFLIVLTLIHRVIFYICFGRIFSQLRDFLCIFLLFLLWGAKLSSFYRQFAFQSSLGRKIYFCVTKTKILNQIYSINFNFKKKFFLKTFYRNLKKHTLFRKTITHTKLNDYFYSCCFLILIILKLKSII